MKVFPWRRLFYQPAAQTKRTLSREGFRLCEAGGHPEKIVSLHLSPPSLLSSFLNTQQGQLTSLINTAIGLQLQRVEQDGKQDGGVAERCEWGSGLLMGGSAVEGRNKSAEWKIRKRNLSHHCWFPLCPLSRCKRSMDSQGEDCVSAQLLHLFKWDSQLHEVRRRILSICCSATAVHVWMKGSRHTVEAEGDGESAGWADLRERNRINSLFFFWR